MHTPLKQGRFTMSRSTLQAALIGIYLSTGNAALARGRCGEPFDPAPDQLFCEGE